MVYAKYEQNLKLRQKYVIFILENLQQIGIITTLTFALTKEFEVFSNTWNYSIRFLWKNIAFEHT